MPRVTSAPPGFAAFNFHGLDFVEENGQGITSCPLCDRERKFYVNPETGLWDCKICGVSGNPLTFLRQYYELCFKNTSLDSYAELAAARSLLYAETPMIWGAAKSILTGEWVLPAYSSDTKLHQLYRYIPYLEEGRIRHRLLPTPGVWPSGEGHGLFGVPLFESAKPEGWLCEGPWDGMAAWEALGISKPGPDGNLMFTGSESASLRSITNVLATPGANVFHSSWCSFFGGKLATMLYDSDHPRYNAKTGKHARPVGYAGMQRVANIFAASESKPALLQYLYWGDEGYNQSYPDGFDVRDVLKAASTQEERCTGLQRLRESLRPIPAGWVAGRSPTSTPGVTRLELLPCDNWGDLIMAWRKAMKWFPGLEKALAVMLSSVMSVMAPGGQLWIRVIGPAGSGKTSLAEALSANEEYVFAKSTLTGFHSGYKGEGDRDQDNSIIPFLMNKTFITKDGDTILQAENKGKILGQARDLFDRVARVFYGNQINRTYPAVNMTWIICGTGALRILDQSELGERFLTVCIMKGIDDDLEDAVLMRIAFRTERNMSIEVNGKAESQDDPDMIYAKQMTGGYVGYLRRNAQRLYDSTKMSDEHLRQCTRLAKFVAYFRARPSKSQKEIAEREFGGRLAEQFVRLAKSLAAVQGRASVDDYIMEMCRSVALDSTEGQTMTLAREMSENEGEGGALPKSLAILINEKDEKTWELLYFMAKIGAAEYVETEVGPGVSGPKRWRLTPRVGKLYREVMNLV